MRPILLALLLTVAGNTFLPGQNKIYLRILFPTGSDHLDPAALRTLDTLQTLHQEGKLRGVEIHGHTDAIGSADDNQSLSRRRALSVARQLREDGLPSSKIRLKASGQSDPVASNQQARGRQANRRVEITAWLNPEPETEVPVLAEAPEKPKLYLQPNEFLVRCDTTNHFSGRKGATLLVPPNAFDTCGPLVLRLQEFHRFGDVAGNLVSTMAGDTSLESAGMVCISAFMDGKQLRDIRAGVPVEVAIPATTYDPEMGLYFAQNRPRKDQLVWQSSAQQAPRFDSLNNTYIFTITELGCINLDKPAIPAESGPTMPIAVRVKKPLLRVHHLYSQYQRGTYVKGTNKGKKYLVFAPEEVGNQIELKGSLSDTRYIYRIHKKLRVQDDPKKIVELEGQEFRVVASINRRAINRKDKFKDRKMQFGMEATRSYSFR